MDVITQILEIDKNARERLSRANEEKKMIIVEAQQEENRIKSEIIERAEHRLEKVEEYEKSIADEKLAEISERKSAQIKALDEAFKANHDRWEKEVFENILAI